MRSAILEALPATLLVAAEGFAVAFTISWLVIAPLWNTSIAWASAPVFAAVAALVIGILVMRYSLRTARFGDLLTP